MIPAVRPLGELLKLNTRLFLNSLDGVGDDVAQRRPGDGGNSMAFIALHVLDARCWLTGYLGREYAHPYHELESVRHIEEIEEFPAIEGVRTVWREVSAILQHRFAELTESDLKAESSQKFPIEDSSVLGGIAFMLSHESYHIGQLGFLRNAFGVGPLSYD